MSDRTAATFPALKTPGAIEVRIRRASTVEVRTWRHVASRTGVLPTMLIACAAAVIQKVFGVARGAALPLQAASARARETVRPTS